MEGRQRIAIIGGGVAGMTAAWLLAKRHEVTLFEKNDYLGGHTHTIPVEGEGDEAIPVDTGFIVYNDRTYPNFNCFLNQLGVSGRESEMSFSYWDYSTNFGYAGTSVNGLFAQRRNLFRPSFWQMLKEIRRFGRIALEEIASNSVPDVTLGTYLTRHQFSAEFVEWYILPMGAAIWSMPPQDMLLYPIINLLRFLGNHGLLSLEDRAQWKTILGGSWSYVKAFQRKFLGKILLQSPTQAVWRDEAGSHLQIGGHKVTFDQVVLACHADESLALLQDATAEESSLLGAWKYSANKTVLHTDESVLPPLKRAWAAWNYRREVGLGQPVTLTYHMNRLQGLETGQQYCVTLNSPHAFPTNSVIAEMMYHHPQYTPAALAAQARLAELNGKRTWFCGSYFANGFHEDAVRSGVDIGKEFGVAL